MKVPQIWSASQSVGSWVTAVAMAVLGASPGDAVSRAMSDPSQSNSESKSSSMQHIEHNGLAVDVSISQLDTNGGRLGPLVGQPAMVQVTLTDARTGAPVVGIRPRAWMNSRPSDMVADEVACTDKIRRLMSGRLGSRADIDLNRYVILAMNHDRTISIIDPFLDFSPTKLESLVTLPSVGLDWVLTQDQNTLYVTMPDVDELR
ncbi:MAG: hypothetical protein MRJ68_15335 [Nitrospira sp.]|nr:hypothetical protein [Nitrospira sp.]